MLNWVKSFAWILGGVGIGFAAACYLGSVTKIAFDPYAFGASLLGTGFTVAGSFALVERQLNREQREKGDILKFALIGVRTRIEILRDCAGGAPTGTSSFKDLCWLIVREVDALLAIRNGNPPQNLHTYQIYNALRRIDAVDWQVELEEACEAWTLTPGAARKTEANRLTTNVYEAVTTALQQIGVH